MQEDYWSDPNLIQTIKEGNIAVIPTDTILGIVCSALNKESVEKLYTVRQRNQSKPFIILLSSFDELEKFGIEINEIQKNKITIFSDKITSFVLDIENQNLEYLHRGTNSLAFRVPKNKLFQNFLAQIGPIVAPSANTEGNVPATNEKEARDYFLDKVNYYSPFHVVGGIPSRIVHLYKDGTVSIIRE